MVPAIYCCSHCAVVVLIVLLYLLSSFTVPIFLANYQRYMHAAPAVVVLIVLLYLLYDDALLLLYDSGDGRNMEVICICALFM
jgi:hypothetical protein